MKMNQTTHCIFCETKLTKSALSIYCPNKECYSKYQYGSRSADLVFNRSFKIKDIWYHYYEGSMRIYNTNSGNFLDLEKHLTLEQIKNYQIFL